MSIEEDAPPPPSYNDTTVDTPHPILRRPLFSRPEAITSHPIDIVPYAAPATFPYPEPTQLWLSRDVSKEDWATFIATLLFVGPPAGDHKEKVSDSKKSDLKNEDGQDTDGELLQRMYDVLAKWNEGFFESRGLKVIPAGSEKAGATSGRAVKLKFGPDKFGFQIGAGVFGVDLSSKSAP